MEPELENVRIDVDGHVATVTLDRPPVNALDQRTFREIGLAFGSLAYRRDVRVAIFNS